MANVHRITALGTRRRAEPETILRYLHGSASNPGAAAGPSVIAIPLTMAVPDGAIVNVALPIIARDLQVGHTTAFWVIYGYQLAVTIALLSPASTGDAMRYRRTY